MAFIMAYNIEECSNRDEMHLLGLGPAQFDLLSSPNPLPFVLLLGMEMGWGRQGARSAAHRGVSFPSW